MSLFRPSNLPAAALVVACAALAACGGGSDGGAGSSPPPPTTYSAASGVAQKGPLATGSTVTMRELGLNLAATGPTHTATTDSDLGTFNPGTTFATSYIGVSATGFYRDEVADASSDGPLTLQSYADLGVDTTLNANLLTTLAYARIERLLNQAGLPFADARAQAEREVLAAFGIATTPAVAHFGALDLADAGASGAATDGDRILAALSAVFVQGRSSADVAALIAAVQADIAAHGTITDAATRASIASSAQALDLDRAVANLNRLYAPAVIAPAALAEWLDRDGDGVIGRDEFVDAGGSGSFTLPSDFAAAHAGATVAASAGASLWINGTPVGAPTTLQAGDVVTLAEPATPPQGVFKAWLEAGTTRIARVVFVNGLASIAVTPDAGTVPAGLTQHFVATGRFGDGHTEDLSGAVTWTSSAPAVADIDAGSGDADALAAGGVTITASVGEVSGSTSLDVITAALRSLAITPGTLTTGVGVARPLVATGTFTDGSVANVTGSVTWTSLSTATAAVSHGRVTGVALGSTTVTASFGDVSASATVDVTTDTWTPAAAMPTSRIAGATVTTLADGSVLVIGGAGDGAAGTAAVDVYDPLSRRWLAAGARAPMAVARSAHTATLLPDGRVLVVGGSSPGGSIAQGYTNNASAEIYDPAHDQWTEAAPMAVARAHHTATLLPDGRVLVTGGEDDHYVPVASAELYDPAADTWSAVQVPMGSPRSTHTATLLPGGQVLVAGGFDIVQGVLVPLADTELYDPAHDTFTSAAPTLAPHAGHTATLLADGRLLVAGGGNGRAELFDPGTGLWVATGAMASARTGQAAVLLPTAQLLLAGGTQAAPNAEHYDVAGGKWTAASAMSVNRPTPLAALLPDGSVLVCGGAAGATSTSCETWW